ncbi:Phosphotransferase enzyme family protein [Planctomycetes bacterium Pla86]|uniref:Phosphotransferase enzyme family protein n=1 Tax=Engelhardtia mirabilis TaxID=2528011 RepID=A0A518BQT4_9BACT|nr:Phosphotransferase enzyme family protein [Planctomycetes bacterium Pla133]QDV03660.1 Phosphotransferase enzyme family protein [Planctomycetes bacterium Pla86]
MGETVLPERIASPTGFALDLAGFLRALPSIPANNGPPAGPRNFHRGGDLACYDAQFREDVEVLSHRLKAAAVSEVWAMALSSHWGHAPGRVHGGMAVGNLPVESGKLGGVIDLGATCVGDPACDLVPAWTFLGVEGCRTLRDALPLDRATWERGRGWVLWKALIVAAGLAETNAWEGGQAWSTIASVLADHAEPRGYGARAAEGSK